MRPRLSTAKHNGVDNGLCEEAGLSHGAPSSPLEGEGPGIWPV